MDGTSNSNNISSEEKAEKLAIELANIIHEWLEMDDSKEDDQDISTFISR